MNKDKNIPFTLEEEKKLAKPRLILKFSPFLVMFGFFGGFAGLVLTIIGFADFEEDALLGYIGLPLLILGTILIIYGMCGRNINKKVYEKILYRLLHDNFGENKYEKLDLSSFKKTYLKDENLLNITIDNVLNENYEYKSGTSDIKVLNILRSHSTDTNKEFINKMFNVSNSASVGGNKLNLTLSFVGALFIIDNINLKLSFPLEIRNKDNLLPKSMLYEIDASIKIDDNFNKEYEFFAKNERFYSLLSDELKNDLLNLKSKEISVLLILKENKAYLFVKDLFVAPSYLIKRFDENIYQKYSHLSEIYFAINKIVNDLIRK